MIRSARNAARRLTAAALVATVALVSLSPAGGVPAARAAGHTLTMVISGPNDLDPATASDAASSAVIAQLFECLVYLDSTGAPQPALASKWEASSDGLQVTFTMRDGLAFSDGSPLTADDVVRSWLRALDPAHAGGLKSLLYGVVGAQAYGSGSGEKGGVGISASGNQVIMHLVHPDASLPAIIAVPTFAIVPKSIDSSGALDPGAAFVGSGGYTLASRDTSHAVLQGNPHYWAGPPAIPDVTLSFVLEKPAETALANNEVDWVPVASRDVPWMEYDGTLGPELREWSDMSTLYYGFDTTKAPFNDARVRKAFASAVDWNRIVTTSGGGAWTAATSLVPPGIPGRSETDFLPAYDPAGAKQLLADAGYADPAAFPALTLVTSGGSFDEHIVEQLRDALGITVKLEFWDFQVLSARLGTADGPAFWSMMWIADYPSPYDFLGILLGSGQPWNQGHWSNAAFDAAIARATSSTDQAAATQAYDEAQAIVRDDVPVIPVAYPSEAALSRTGLLGAEPNGTGIFLIAHMAWAEGAQ
jgi:oligopeptide transport system substrate-binding protein